MAAHYRTLAILATDILTESEIEELGQLFSEEPFNLQELVQFDQRLGGPGFSNVSCQGHGRYHVEDRDIFRPLQYCSRYFELAYEGSEPEWLTRSLVQMSSLHIESLVKRIAGGSQYPLGRVLRDIRVRQKIAPDVWLRIDSFTRIYNEAKHTVNHPKDTHLFSVEDAIMAYLIARKLAISLYPVTRLYTDLTVFSEECS